MLDHLKALSIKIRQTSPLPVLFWPMKYMQQTICCSQIPEHGIETQEGEIK